MTDLDDTLLQRRVDGLLAPWGGDAGGGPGVTIGVVIDGALRVHRHAGMASVEWGVPIGDDTRFRIASVSKQFTCAAILMLEGEGKLSLDAPARTYLPELPDAAASVTVAQLMHNTSGLRDMLEIIRQGGADLGTPITPADLLDGITRQRTLNFEPGSRFLYSNTNFLLLGLIAERLCGQALGETLEARIFAPLGMRDTRLTPSTTETVPRLATGYLVAEGGGWMRAPHAFPLGGEGGLVSSVVDLALWARNLVTRRVGAAWIEGLTTQTPFTNGSRNRYARGLVVRPHRGIETWSHGGLWPGYRTEFLLAPALGVAVIAIANTGRADPNLLAHRALDAVLEARPGVVAAPPPLPHATVAPLAGRYIDDATDATLDIAVAEDGTVTLTSNGLPVVAEATEDGRVAAPRSNGAFIVRAAGPDAIEVEQDAGTTGRWRRAPASAEMPQGLAGTYRSAEMAAEWVVAEDGGQMSVRASGPVARGAAWPMEAVADDLVRVHVPGTLFRTWLDMRVVREQGQVRGLLVSGGRVKRVRYDRVD